MAFRLSAALLTTVLALGVTTPAFASPADIAAFDPDKDGTLDAKELTSRLTASELKAADPDSDGTLDKKEYLAVVAARFEAADPDAEGTIDAKELSSPAGASLLTLIK